MIKLKFKRQVGIVVVLQKVSEQDFGMREHSGMTDEIILKV